MIGKKAILGIALISLLQAVAFEENTTNYDFDTRIAGIGGSENTTNYNSRILLSQSSVGYQTGSAYRWYLGGIDSHQYFINVTITPSAINESIEYFYLTKLPKYDDSAEQESLSAFSVLMLGASSFGFLWWRKKKNDA